MGKTGIPTCWHHQSHILQQPWYTLARYYSYFTVLWQVLSGFLGDYQMSSFLVQEAEFAYSRTKITILYFRGKINLEITIKCI